VVTLVPNPAAMHLPCPNPVYLPPGSVVQVIAPINGDPFIGMLETPVTSSPLVASYLSNLPAYRTAVSPLLRGVEIGLAHGFLLVGPFIKLGPLRNVEGVAEVAGTMSGAGLVLILAACLSAYGAVTFQNDTPQASNL
jgi:photosystem I subunit 11